MASSLVTPGLPIAGPGPAHSGRSVPAAQSGRSAQLIEARPRFVLLAAAYAALIFVYFTANEFGYLAGLQQYVPVFDTGLIGVGFIALTTPLWLRAPERAQFALSGILALIVTVPINRATGVNRLEILLFIGVCALLALIAILSSHSEFSRPTLVLFTVMLVTMFVSTVLASSGSGFLKFGLAMVPAVSAFLIAGRLGHAGRRNVAIVILVIACTEALLAIPEPFLFPQQLWNGVTEIGAIYPNSNLIPGLVRARGTLGHPLPLGFLLTVGLALLLRVVEPRWWIKWPLAVLLLTAVLMTGSRNSLILALVLLLFYPGKKLTSVRLLWSALAAAILVLVGVLTNQISFAFVNDFAASGSYTHRAAALDAFGQLLSRQSLLHTVLGNGFGGIQSLFAAGLLQTDGLDVVDNEFVAQLGQAGLIGLSALVVLTVRPLFARDWHWRGATLVVLANCMIYDWLSWPNSATLALFVLGSAYANVDVSAKAKASTLLGPVFAPRSGARSRRGAATGTAVPQRAHASGVASSPPPSPVVPALPVGVREPLSPARNGAHAAVESAR